MLLLTAAVPEAKVMKVGLATVPSADARAYCNAQLPLLTEPMTAVGDVITAPSTSVVLTPGGGGNTVKPPVAVTISVPVVSDTSRAPAIAAGSMLTTAVALVAELTVRDTTVVPAPKVTVVVP